MPYIEPRRSSSGTITSYKIVVSDGYDCTGKQIRRRCIWTPPRPGMTERQMEKEATAAAYKFEEQINNGYRLDNTQSFAEYAQYVIDLKEQIGIKPTTIDRYIELLKRILPVFGHMEIGKIRPQHLNQFYKDLKEKDGRLDTSKATAKRALKTTISELGISRAKLSRDSGISATTVGVAIRGDAVAVETAEAISKALEGEFDDFFKLQESKVPLSDKTILEHHRLISTILAQAEKEMLLTYNPAAKATPPRAKKSKPDYYQPDEIDEILVALEKAPLKWRTITYLLIDTGARRGEIMGLKWENLNLDTGLVIIDHALLYTKSKGVFEGETKTDNTRAMVLAPQTMDLLKKWHVEYLRLKMKNGDRWIDNGYIFTQDDGRPMHPDSITDWLGEFSKKHDLPHIHPHAFRHTAASTMIANGVDIVTTAGELGHASPSTTANIYAHQIAVAKAKAANVRAGVFSGRDSKSKKKRA